MDNQKNFAERLVRFREAERYPQIEFAELLGVDTKTLYNYEAGNTSPPANILEKLRPLGINFHWLFTGQGSMKSSHIFMVAEGGIEGQEYLPEFLEMVDHLKGNLKAQCKIIGIYQFLKI